MSYPPPYFSGHRVFKTLAGLVRAIERFDGECLGFDASAAVLRVRWPAGTQEYPVEFVSDEGTKIELQLQYDLEP